jgi:glutamine synthetase
LKTADIEALQASLTKQGVKYFIGAFVDGLGVPKSKIVPIGSLASAAKGSELYTVGALEAMGELGPNEDECAGIPDLSRTVVLPWDDRYALAPTDLLFKGKPYERCSRQVLKKQVAAAKSDGFVCNMGIEPEVYVLKSGPEGWRPYIDEDVANLPTRGYDVDTTLLADKFLEPMVEYIDALGWGTYSFDHEGGQGQYEFDFGYTDVLSMADRMVLFRLMSKHVARSLGCIATYMPKPWSEAFGSGAHINMSLARDGDNAFKAKEGSASAEARGYSALAGQFTAGVLKHIHAITLVACPTVNSYKRLTPRGKMNEMSWAPVYAAYGHNNRTLAARLPMNRHCLEVRHVDSATNFYLSAAMILAAGLAGIREKLPVGAACELNTYAYTEHQLAEMGIHRLPRTLGEAIAAFREDAFAKEVMGPDFHDAYVKYKEAEWQDYCLTVGDWEAKRYMQLW